MHAEPIVAARATGLADTTSSRGDALRALMARELSPKVLAIDLDAEYPEHLLRALGAAGAFAGAGASAPERGAVDDNAAEWRDGGRREGLGDVIEVIAETARHCLSASFLVWCQTACARYIAMSSNAQLRRDWLRPVLRGEQLAGTGLSNTIKSADGIEAYRLRARRVDGGYLLNGVLPWVSNLGPDHVFATGCPVEGESGLVFVLVDCAQPGLRLVDGARFVALDGTRTMACHFGDSFVPDERVLAQPDESGAYLSRIKPGMILAQTGMALGLVDACASLVRQAGRTHSAINAFVDDQAEDLEAPLASLRERALALADALDDDPRAAVIADVVRARLGGGELALRAANAAMLHQGARGYLRHAAAQRRLREAYFIAIVTPAIKHLRKVLASIESGRASPPDAVGAL